MASVGGLGRAKTFDVEGDPVNLAQQVPLEPRRGGKLLGIVGKHRQRGCAGAQPSGASRPSASGNLLRRKAGDAITHALHHWPNGACSLGHQCCPVPSHIGGRRTVPQVRRVACGSRENERFGLDAALTRLISNLHGQAVSHGVEPIGPFSRLGGHRRLEDQHEVIPLPTVNQGPRVRRACLHGLLQAGRLEIAHKRDDVHERALPRGVLAHQQLKVSERRSHVSKIAVVASLHQRDHSVASFPLAYAGTATCRTCFSPASIVSSKRVVLRGKPLE